MRYVAAIFLLLAACDIPVDAERVAQRCEERARASQGPTGSVTVGANSNDGPFVSGEIGITGDFLAGRDAQQVYEDCVFQRTGQGPIRPANLRR